MDGMTKKQTIGRSFKIHKLSKPLRSGQKLVPYLIITKKLQKIYINKKLRKNKK